MQRVTIKHDRTPERPSPLIWGDPEETPSGLPKDVSCIEYILCHLSDLALLTVAVLIATALVLIISQVKGISNHKSQLHGGAMIMTAVTRSGVMSSPQPALYPLSESLQSTKDTRSSHSTQVTELMGPPRISSSRVADVHKAPWTLPRRRPYLIAHRGASEAFPEHTLAAYRRAIQDGADFIECDVVLTKDLHPVCRHEPNLSKSTDAMDKLPELIREYSLDGSSKRERGVFSFDLSLGSLKNLTVRQPWPSRDQKYNGAWKIPTLAEYLDLVRSANRTVGVYIETKHPGFFNNLQQLRDANTTVEDILVSSLKAAGFNLTGAMLNSQGWLSRPIFLQSFEAASLKRLRERTCAPLIMLLEPRHGGSMNNTKDPASTLLISEAELDDLATWASGVGASKDLFLQWEPHLEAQQREGDNRSKAVLLGGNTSFLLSGRLKSSGLLERLHAKGLQVHPYTFRDEPFHVMGGLDGDAHREMAMFLGTRRVSNDRPGLDPNTAEPHISNITQRPNVLKTGIFGGTAGRRLRQGQVRELRLSDLGGNLTQAPKMNSVKDVFLDGADGMFVDDVASAFQTIQRAMEEREGLGWPLDIVNKVSGSCPFILL